MASAATRARGAARRPFAMLASPSPARDGGAITSAENVAALEVVPFAHRVRRFGKCAGGKAAARTCGGAGSSPFPVSKNPATTASRSRMSSFSQKRCSTPTTTAPLRDLSEDRGGKVRDSLSSPFDEADQALQERRSGEAASRKRMVTRSAAMEEAMASLPEPGEGRVKYLVGTFERLLSLSLAGGGPELRSGGATKGRRTKSEATPAAAEEIDVSSYPSSEVSFPAIACILDASDRTSMIRAARELQRQRRCNSTGSPQRTCSRKVASVTSQRPFNLRAEQRGKAKEENFVQRMRKMQLEEEMMRNPLAQGLPFTTDEPEYPVKPPTKEPTEPIDLVLHSDVRALRCSLAVDEFLRALHRLSSILQVAERASFMEEVKLAEERQQKMDEELEIKQLRKETVPRAHPMPDFTKPFVPKRSVKPHTIPREPRFHPRLRRNTVKA